MTDNIKGIFDSNIRLIGAMDKAVYYFREQQYDKALSIVADSIDQIKHVIEEIINDMEYFELVTTESLLEMLTGILEAKKNKDYILLADLIELQLINFLIGVQELIIRREEIVFNEENYKQNIEQLSQNGIGFTEDLHEAIDTDKLLESGYRVEFTSCGQMTLAAENEGQTFYFHTNSKVQEEAFLLAKHWYQCGIKKFFIYGFGMGYHVNELQKLAPEAEITVYEADLNVMKLACAFSDCKELLNRDRIKIIYDPNLQAWNEKSRLLNTDEAMYVHYPSFLNIRNEEGKELLKKAFPWQNLI